MSTSSDYSRSISPSLPHALPFCLCSMTAAWAKQTAFVAVKHRQTCILLGQQNNAHQGNSIFIYTYCTVPRGEGSWRIKRDGGGGLQRHCQDREERTNPFKLQKLSCSSTGCSAMSGWWGWTLMGRGGVEGWLKWRLVGCMCVYSECKGVVCACMCVSPHPWGDGDWGSYLSPGLWFVVLTDFRLCLTPLSPKSYIIILDAVSLHFLLLIFKLGQQNGKLWIYNTMALKVLVNTYIFVDISSHLIINKNIKQFFISRNKRSGLRSPPHSQSICFN